MCSGDTLTSALLAVACFLVPAAACGGDLSIELVPVATLERGLIDALGDSFEFLESEIGSTKARVGYWEAERFWYAKVRAKTAGEFGVSYSVKFDFPEDPRFSRMPDQATYVIPICIGKRGAPRIVFPRSTWGGSTYPHANVGDTLIIPVHVDRFRKGHDFEAASALISRETSSSFHVANQRRHEQYIQMGMEPRVVRNDAPDRLQVLACAWGATMDRSLTTTHHGLTAYLQFERGGTLNLGGRLLNNAKNDQGGVPIHVVPTDQPVTVVMEHFHYKQHTGESTYGSSGSIPPGTIFARVGDRVVVNCGGYSTSAEDKPATHPLGVVEALTFHPKDAYSPISTESVRSRSSAGGSAQPDGAADGPSR
jgi:hypothetical protein